MDRVGEITTELGEGPVWDAERRRLLFVDIMRGHVHALDPATGDDRIHETGRPVGAVAPTVRGDWVVALSDGFFRLDPDSGALSRIALVEADRADTRMNDGYVDPRGRFWAGTMSLEKGREQGSLYRLDPDGAVTRMLTGVTTSNGLDWSPDERLMYYVDTGEPRIDVFDFAADAGTITNRRTLIVIDGPGKPDGLIVDAEGCLWLCLWQGGEVRRYAPDGQWLDSLPVPAQQSTKCAFGGADLRDLYVTSAWIGMDEQARAAQPLAGALFHARPGPAGQPPRRFGG